MSTNREEQNVFDGDCIDLTDDPTPRNKSNKKMVLLLNTDKPVEEITTLINNAFKKSSPKNPVLAQQKPDGTHVITKIVPKTNKKVAEFGYTATARTPVRRETTPAKKNVVVLSTTVVHSGKPQDPKKPTPSLNPGINDIILAPSSSDIRNKKFPTNATDDDVTFLSVRQLKTRPTPKPSQLTPKPVAQFKTGIPKPVATISTPPTVPNLQKPVPQLGTSTQITNPGISILKKSVPSQPDSQMSKPICASTDSQNATPVKQVSAPIRKVVHVLPKSLNEEKQLVQEIKRSPALPQLQNLCLPAKGKSRDEVLKALREVSASARITKPGVQQITVKKLVQNPFSRKRNFRVDAPVNTSNEKEQCHFYHNQARKTYQKDVTNASSLEFSHYVRSEDAYTDVTAPQENRQKILKQSVSNAASTQDKSTPSTLNTQVHSESVQQSDSCDSLSTVILNSPLGKSQPLQNIVKPFANRSILKKDLVKKISDQINYANNKGVISNSINQQRQPSQVRDEALPCPQIPVKNVCSIATNETVTEENPFHSTPTTQISPDSFERDGSPPPVLQAVTIPPQSNEPNVIPTTSTTKSVSRSILQNPQNRVAMRKKALQNYVPPTDDPSLAVNLTDLAETVSAVANINGQTSEVAKTNQIVYLLYPVDNKTGTVLQFKEGQIQQIVALVPSDSGLVPLPVKEKKEEELGCGDYPLLPLATKVKEKGEEPQPLLPVEAPISETVENDKDEVILISDDADIEIEPPAAVTPVDISTIINRFHRPFPKSRCLYYNSNKKTYIKYFKGFTCREKQKSSCLREMRALEKRYTKEVEKMRQDVFLKYDSNIIYCSSNENEFLPETVKIEIKEEVEDVEVVTILDDEEDPASDILPTIGDVISQVNREVFKRQHPRTVSKEDEAPPEEALELIKKGLEMIKHWSQETGTANKLETIIRNKLEEPIPTNEKEKGFLPQKRKSTTQEDTQVVKMRGRRSKTDKDEKRPIASTSRSTPKKAVKTPTVVNANGGVPRKRLRVPKAIATRIVRKKAVGRAKVTNTNESAIPGDKKNGRKSAVLEDDGDGLLLVKRVDILKSNTNKKGRRRKQT